MHVKHILLALSITLSLGAFAQHNEEVTIEGTYRPKVNKVNKILMNPETPKQSIEMPNTEVNVLDVDHRFRLHLDKLSPLNYNNRKGQGDDAAKNFLMAGLGTRISPVFLYKHNSNLTKNLGLGVGIKHFSSWLGIKDYAPSGFMNNAFDIGLTSSKYNNVQLAGNVYYKNDMYHYYGVNLTEHPLTEQEIEDLCPRQTYNTIGAHFGVIPTSTRVGELSHKFDLDYSYTFNNTYASEHYAGLGYGIAYTQNWWGNKNHPQRIGMNLSFQYGGLVMNEGSSLNHRILLKTNPFFEMKDEFYRLHLGFRFDFGINGEDKHLCIRPDLSGSLFVLNKKLEFYAGLNGGFKMLTFSQIIEENPFMGHWTPLLFQNVKLGFDGGVRTNIMEVVDLHLGVRYRRVENDPLYIPYDDNTFMMAYDETQTVSVLVDTRVKLRNSLTADLGFVYNNCSPTVAEYAWYRPTTEGKLKLTYDANENLAFNTTFLYQGGRYAKPYNGSAFKLKDVFDLGLGADYHINEQLSVFARLDNLLNQKYQLFYDYPVTGIEFFAGMKMSF
jgi:outer membrane receptor protein involved in Fe transport